MNLTFRPATDVPIADIAGLFTRAFDGYIAGTRVILPPDMSDFIFSNNVHLNFSQIAFDGDQPVALACVSRQGGTNRLAVMGVDKPYHGKGVGKQLIAELLSQARKRSDDTYILEVIEQNTKAVKLYSGAGFEIMERLLGYKASTLEAIPDDALEQIDLTEAARAITYFGSSTLPWQISGSHLMRVGAPNVAFRLGHAIAMLSNPDAASIRLLGFLTLPEHQNQGHGTRLLKALSAKYPNKSWFIPALCPEQYGGFLVKLGFVQDELSQFQMKISLAP
jgi:GNAT superfamily N-acetyltransferase